MFCVIAKRGSDGRFLPGTRIGDEEIPRETILDFAEFVAKRMQAGIVADSNREEHQTKEKEKDTL